MSTKNNIIVFPGSFDPIHIGHLAVIKKAINLGYEVIVLVANNENKNHSKELTERYKDASNFLYLNELSNVKVSMLNIDDLTPNYMKRNNYTKVLRGIRNNDDSIYESNLKKEYLSLNPSLDFIYINTPLNISSSILKEQSK